MLILKSKDYWVLKHLIDRGQMTFKDLESWAFNQYTDDGIDPAIEQLGLAIDFDEAKTMLDERLDSAEYLNTISAEFLLGEARTFYLDPNLNKHYRHPVYNLSERDGVEIQLPELERNLILDVTNFYGEYDSWEPRNPNWQDMEKNGETRWQNLIEISQKYESAYKSATDTFNLY